MATLVEAVTADADPAVVTLSVAPQAGDLLVAWQWQRAGTAFASFTAPAGFAATGVEADVSLADGTFRRATKLWFKIAGGSEGTNYSFDDGTIEPKRVVFAVFRPDSGQTFSGTVLAVGNNNNGTTTNGAASGITFATGTTSSQSGKKLLIGAIAMKNSTSTTVSPFNSWSSEALTVALHVDGGSNGRSACVGYSQVDNTSTHASTANFDTNLGNVIGLNAGMAVFEVTVSVVPPTFVYPPTLRYSRYDEDDDGRFNELNIRNWW